ncbi:MAG TPA: protein translocase subunit SecD [Desulfobulbaceae bacterium]|nr:protein translocase subunit SecD [Desulfobulbaceae bacterium]
MNTSLKLKFGLLLTLIIFAFMVLVPSFYPGAPDWWKKYLAPGGLKLGLDLQGGMHLVLRVDLKKAVENSLDLAASDLKDGLAEKNITAVRMESPDPHQIVFTLPNTGAVDTVNQIIKEDFPNLDITVAAEKGSFPRITLKLTNDEIDFIHKNAVNQSLEIIRNRIDQFGVAEPVILRQGENEIVVQLPGVKDPDRAMGLIGQTAQLEFKLVADDTGVDLNKLIGEAVKAGQWKEGDSRKQLNLALQSRLPKGTEVYFQRIVDDKTKKERQVPILLNSQVLMTGEMVKNAQVRIGGSFNEPYVSLDLTGRGGKIFGSITEKNVDKRLAIVLDEVVRSAPVIREKILGGKAQISGSFTHEEATDLAIVLRVGALPAPVEIIQNLTVGASLGQDSINKGLTSGLFGALMVLVFMVIYYRLSGIIADLSLALNIFFLFAGLAMLGATLTLPGIAGIILSIGMAVDANVLIFERMREEFELGKSVKSGVDAGFNKAFWSIVDSQVTTLITAMALFLFGTGPIKGFAVTLSLGIIFNLFAVLFCSRLVYDMLYGTRTLKELKFLRFVKKPNFDFMKIRKFAFAFSAALVLMGLVSFAEILRGDANMGVDFSGGSLLQYKADQPFQLDEVRSAFKKNGYPGIDLQQVTGENRLIVKIKKSEETVGHLAEEITAVLTKEEAGKGFILESQSEIGSSVSAVLRNKAIQAIAISLLGVLFYLAIRFDMSFGLAAAAATFHDVLAVLGICWLLNMEITLLLVTALLTLG